MRLLYASPVEVVANGGYGSKLNSFEYIMEKWTVRLELKNNLIFSDGSTIQLKDFSLPIKRLILANPSHPTFGHVFKNNEWLKNKFPLMHKHPGIIEDIDKKTLEIKFDKNIKTPFESFISSRLSIMPSSCFDLKKNTLICQIPPQSGRFTIESFDPSLMEIKSRKSGKKYNVVQTSYEDLWSNTEIFKTTSVLLIDEQDISPTKFKIVQNLNKIRSSKNKINMIWYNLKNPIFKDQRRRQFFSREFRKSLKELGIKAEGSIFTNTMAGYEDLATLEKKMAPFSKKEEADILTFLRKNKPLFCHERHSSGTSAMFIPALQKTFANLGIPFEQIRPMTSEEQTKLRLEGKIAGIMGASKIDASDPIHSIKNSFGTTLSPLIRNDEEKLSKLVRELKKGDLASYYRFNEYMFLEDERAIFSHSTEVLLSAGKLPRISYTDVIASPWFLFDEE